MSYQGVAIRKHTDNASDSDDVKSVSAWGKFVAVSTAQRFAASSYFQGWESTDGINSTPSAFGSGGLTRCAHNAGTSGNESGYIDPTSVNHVVYAYGSTWGNWSTRINPITLLDSALSPKPQLYTATPNNGGIIVDFQPDSKATSFTIGYGTDPVSYTTSITGVTNSPYVLTGLTPGTTH